MLAVESPVEPSQSALHSHEADLATPTQVDLVHLFDTQAFLLVPTAGPAMRAAGEKIASTGAVFLSNKFANAATG